MNKSDLQKQLAEKFPYLSNQDIGEAMEIILRAMTERLMEGGRIEIRGFASFSTRERPPRVGRNPKTGESVQVPAKRIVHFKAGAGLVARVNDNDDLSETAPVWKAAVSGK